MWDLDPGIGLGSRYPESMPQPGIVTVRFPGPLGNVYWRRPLSTRQKGLGGPVADLRLLSAPGSISDRGPSPTRSQEARAPA